MRPVANVTMTPMAARLVTRAMFLTVQRSIGFLLILGKTAPVTVEAKRTRPERSVMEDQLLGMHLGHVS